MRFLTSLGFLLLIFQSVAQSWDSSTTGKITYSGSAVGIGTTSPTGSISSNQTGLHILDDNVSYLSLESTAGSGKKYTLYSGTSGSLVFWDASTSTARGSIDVNGNWGIGTSSPGQQLSLLSDKPVIRLQSSNLGNSAYGWLEYFDASSRLGYVGFGSSGNSNLYLMNEAGGNVLIPNGMLEVSNDMSVNDLTIGKYGSSLSGDSDPYMIASPGNTGNHDVILFGNGGGSTLNFRVYDGALKIGSSATPNTQLNNNGDAYFNGNVGIGTTSPTSKLQVMGDIAIDYGKGLRVDTDWNGAGGAYFLKTGYDGARGGDFLDFYVPGDGAHHKDVKMAIVEQGNVGIGTTTPTHKLEVNGTIRAKEVKVEASPWPDYVFASDYELMPLEEIEQFIQSNHHLPEIPSAQEIETNGLQLGEMNRLLLQKIEELTLHVIEQQKVNKSLLQRIEKLEKE